MVVFLCHVFVCMNFPVDNVFRPFYAYPRKVFSELAEILPVRELEATREPAVRVREWARHAYGTEHSYATESYGPVTRDLADHKENIDLKRAVTGIFKDPLVYGVLTCKPLLPTNFP